jgi:hypothetical protein
MTYDPNRPGGFQQPSPYQPPQSQFGGPQAPRPYGALDKLKGPAIALMICAPLGIVFLLVDFVFRIINSNNPEVARQFGGQNPEAAAIGNYVGMGFDWVAIILQIVVIAGAFQMLKGRNYGLAMAAAIISVIPCCSPCCILGIPFGIWALIVLNDQQVKTSFR